MAIENFKNPILVAAKLLEEPIHILVGDGAEQYANKCGFPSSVVKGSTRHSETDTVGAIAQDKNGMMAVASSSGGCSGRPRGRVGDTPLWGPGLWCDDSVCIAATGIGESITLEMLCYRVAEHRNAGNDLKNSLNWGLSLFDESIEVGLIGMELSGEAIAVSNTKMPWTRRIV